MPSTRLSITLAVALALGASQPGAAQSLEQVIQHVLATHPRVRAATATARSVRYEIDQAKAGKAAKFGIIADPGLGYSSLRKEWDQAGDLGVRGTYLLYDGKRTDNEIARQRARFASAEERATLTVDDLIQLTSDAYIEVIKQDKLEELARANVAAHEDLHRKVQEIVKYDKGRQYDLVQVAARLQQAKVTLAAREGAMEEARALLADIAARAINDVHDPRDPSAALPATLRAALDRLEAHPAMRAAQAEVEVAQRAASIASAWDRPRVDLQGTVNSPQDFDGNRKYFGNYDVRFAVQWQPFDGGAGRSAALAAAEQSNAAQENQASVRRDLSNDVTRFWSQIETRRARGAAWLDLVTQTGKVRENYWQQFKIGRRAILDLLNAENETFQARLSAEQERLEVLQAQYRLLGSLAQIDAFLGIAPASAPPAKSSGAPGDLPDMAPRARKR
jgi:outer membrane protein, adhesin transport system